MDLPTLLQYDGVFLGVTPVSNSLLVQYVNAGGNVYVYSAGNANDPGLWNEFLEQFGLQFQSTNTGSGDRPTISSHSIFAGVDHLYQINGSAVVDLAPADYRNRVLVSYQGTGLYAIWDDDPPPLELSIRVSQVEVCWVAVTNKTYQVQYRLSLTGNLWTNLGLPMEGQGETTCVNDSVDAGQVHRFYRVIVLP